MDAKPGSPKGDELDVLVTLIELTRTSSPTPAEAHLGDQVPVKEEGLTRKDMEPLSWRRRVSEVLNGKRPLTLDMIRKLHERLEYRSKV